MTERLIPSGNNLWLSGYYAKIKKDIDGWVDPNDYLPVPYDLVYLKTTTVTIPGWWTGNGWGGRRLKPGMKVMYWKKDGV